MSGIQIFLDIKTQSENGSKMETAASTATTAVITLQYIKAAKKTFEGKHRQQSRVQISLDVKTISISSLEKFKQTYLLFIVLKQSEIKKFRVQISCPNNPI